MIKKNRLSSFLELTRYQICIIAGALALEGFWISSQNFDFKNISAIIAAIVVCTSLAFANAHNDLVDLSTDTVNYPNRPLPSGNVKIGEAKVLIITLVILSLGLAWIVNISMLILTFSVLSISLIYNLWAKKIPILGNLIVASLCALSFFPGYLISNRGIIPIIPLISSFLLILAREFIGSIGDEYGDRLGGRKTINMILGKRKVLFICLILSILSVIAIFCALFVNNINYPILFIIMFFVFSILPLSIAIISIWKNLSPDNIRLVSYKMRLVFFTQFALFLFLV